MNFLIAKNDFYLLPEGKSIKSPEFALSTFEANIDRGNSATKK